MYNISGKTQVQPLYKNEATAISSAGLAKRNIYRTFAVMQYVGELISIAVAFSWTATALLSEFGSKRMGNLTLNLMRMLITLFFSFILFWVMGGTPLPATASTEAYLWMILSGLVGPCKEVGFPRSRQP